MSGNMDGGDFPESTTAVLTLDSDVDSPQRQQPADCDLTNGDEMDVNIAALQRQIYQLTCERDKSKALYSQSQDEIENYQEQILEVCFYLLYLF